MDKIYMFGNTTVRDTSRFTDGLRVLADSGFNGNLNSADNEMGFANALNKAGVVSMKTSGNSIGRKWRSAFDKNGFITGASIRRDKLEKAGDVDPLVKRVLAKYPDIKLSGKAYELTPQGVRLSKAENNYEKQDILLRSLLAIQLNSFDKVGQKYKPFVLILQVINELEQLGDNCGVNRQELLIISAFSDHTKAAEIAKKIIAYRKRRAEVSGKQLKSKFDRENVVEPIANKFGVKADSANTYADPNFKYILRTGLFTRKGRRLAFNSDKVNVINQILKTEPAIIDNEIDYYYQFWSGYPLPTDNKTVLIDEIKRLSEKVQKKFTEEDLNRSIPDLKQLQIQLEIKEGIIQERQFAREQDSEDNLDNIINYLEAVDGKNKSSDEYKNAQDDLPAFFEWATWRSFLAIDGLLNKPEDARGFTVDQDLFPIGNAPGGRPDIELEFEDYVLIVEVTLTSTSRQEAAEAEPVRRHVAIEQEKYGNKPVYGLFLAPSIDNNTAEMFRAGIWYSGENANFVNIVPMTLKQFIYIMQKFRQNRFTNAQFERLVEKCLIPRIATVSLWQSEIDKVVNGFQFA